MINNKICIKCDENKPIKEFHKTTRNKSGFKNTCKTCISEYDRAYRIKNREKLLERSRQYYLDNKQASYLRSRKYWKENSDRIKEQIKDRKRKDSLFKLKCSLRCRTTNAFKTKKWIKTNRLRDILGADYITVKNHLTSTFVEGMSWDNHGEWHIDHIIPLSTANNKLELVKLCHYTNLQALWAEENLSKGNKQLETYK